MIVRLLCLHTRRAWWRWAQREMQLGHKDEAEVTWAIRKIDDELDFYYKRRGAKPRLQPMAQTVRADAAGSEAGDDYPDAAVACG